MKRIKAVMVKELAHILRDPTSLTIVFLMPLVMMFIFGYSINFDLKRIDAGIIDLSKSETSQQLVKKFLNNKYFILHDLEEERSPQLSSLETGERLLKASKLKEIIIIPADFSEKVKGNRSAEIDIILDGSDSNVANLIYQYNELIILDFMSEIRSLEELVKIRTKVLFNPELKSAFFFIPGLIATLLVMISALLTSLSISREKESGSIDLLFISPLKSPEIIIGKTIPYIFVSFIAMSTILLFARFWFGVPMQGNLLVLLLFALLYIITSLSLGILISTIAPSQKIAMFVTLLITLLPSIMLSGFIFPRETLPPVLRGITYIVPATYFLRIIRGVVVKGAELKHFISEGAALVVFTVVLLTIASLKFARDRKKSK
ncbi:MAG TPA: ABC transporter permease [Candidatus Kapabacteria bacterium]|nr:ABC transporter permease [Candidatus Kapabacteria bacterium]